MPTTPSRSHLRHICHNDADDKDDGLNPTVAHDQSDDEEDEANGDGDGSDEVDKLADLKRRRMSDWPIFAQRSKYFSFIPPRY